MNQQREKDLFRKGFHMGRMVWCRDRDCASALNRARELLLFCNTPRESVWTLDPMGFVELVKGGMDRACLEGMNVLMIVGFEGLSGVQTSAFIRALRLFRAFPFGVGIRLILVSNQEFPLELHRIHECMPVILEPESEEADPCEVDSRVHSLVELASKVSETPIRRLTERTALYLEEVLTFRKKEELLLLLVEGVKRSKGNVLRLRDILPNFSHYFGPEDEHETYCN